MYNKTDNANPKFCLTFSLQAKHNFPFQDHGVLVAPINECQLVNNFA